MTEDVILVDEKDNQLGLMEKMEAHRRGVLHRAFSVFVFNSAGNLMIQQRAHEKYHSGGLWTNTCCSHPRQGETLDEATHRRLQEEMGFDCNLEHKFHFIYRADFDNGLIENELDHVFFGIFDGKPIINREEAADWKLIDPEVLRQEISDAPQKFTPWLRIALPKVLNIL